MATDSMLLAITPNYNAKEYEDRGYPPIDGFLLLCFEEGENRLDILAQVIQNHFNHQMTEIFRDADDVDVLLSTLSSFLSAKCGFQVIATPIDHMGTSIVSCESPDSNF